MAEVELNHHSTHAHLQANVMPGTRLVCEGRLYAEANACGDQFYRPEQCVLVGCKQRSTITCAGGPSAEEQAQDTKYP